MSDIATNSKRKVAVIGGGVGAMTAAYALTTVPDWENKFDITVYQLGWRLGGKGASGRNLAEGGRIEEHGLHIWAGFYENAFRLMRDCYDQLNIMGLRDPSAPLGTLDTAFTGLNHFMLAEDIPTENGTEWRPWRIDFEPNTDVPGTGDVIPTPLAYFEMFVEFIVQQLGNLMDANSAAGGSHSTATVPDRFLRHLSSRGVSTSADSHLHHALDYVRALPDDAFQHKTHETGMLGWLTSSFQNWFRAQDFDGVIQNDDLRRLYYMVDLGSAFIKGMAHSNVFRTGFDALDDWECSAWLLHYGASKEAVGSAIFRGCYDYVFGYPGGVSDDREVGAGTAMRGLLRLAFTYKGSLFFKMNAGMGDTIFGPYYQVLKARGVTFKYFNAAVNLGLDADKTHIATIDMVEQAAIKNGEYQPLVDVQDLPCWPSEPDWDQLVDGEKLKASGIDFECEKEAPTGRTYTLQKGVDFDDVVLGASLGSMPYMAQELIAASPRWRLMVEHVGTVATQALQLWLDVKTDDLGWPELVKEHNAHSKGPLKTVMTAFAEPLDTWADMTDLLPREAWPDPGPVNIAYFCSPSHDADFPQPSLKERSIAWMNSELTQLWPKAKLEDGTFNYDLLHDIHGRSGIERMDGQYFRTNYYGSERYVLSAPKTVQHRIAPDNSGFFNLTMAGDWTRCGINAGCVEAATISGLMAAREVSGHEFQIVGEGDLTPDQGPGDEAKLASPFAQNANWPLTPLFLMGKMDGWFRFHEIPEADAAAMLPKGMHLAPQTLTPAGTHPVTMLNNHQMKVRISALPGLLGFPSYMESIVAINNVVMEGVQGTFSYLPILYLDNWGAMISGRVFYNLAKTTGKIEMSNDHYAVRNDKGGAVWSARYAQQDVARPIADFAEFGRIQTLLEEPIVTPGRLNTWQYMAFDFGLSAGYAAPVSAEIEVSEGNGSGIPAGTLTAPALGSQHGTLPGAFRLWCNWTLSNPLDSGRVKRVTAERSALTR